MGMTRKIEWLKRFGALILACLCGGIIAVGLFGTDFMWAGACGAACGFAASDF
jgi:hypothetical protein